MKTKIKVKSNSLRHEFLSYFLVKAKQKNFIFSSFQIYIVCQAEKLRKKNIFLSPNVYAQVYSSLHTDKVFTTRTIEKSSFPSWNECFDLYTYFLMLYFILVYFEI